MLPEGIILMVVDLYIFHSDSFYSIVLESVYCS